MIFWGILCSGFSAQGTFYIPGIMVGHAIIIEVMLPEFALRAAVGTVSFYPKLPAVIIPAGDMILLKARFCLPGLYG